MNENKDKKGIEPIEPMDVGNQKTNGAVTIIGEIAEDIPKATVEAALEVSDLIDTYAKGSIEDENKAVVEDESKAVVEDESKAVVEDSTAEVLSDDELEAQLEKAIMPAATHFDEADFEEKKKGKFGFVKQTVSVAKQKVTGLGPIFTKLGVRIVEDTRILFSKDNQAKANETVTKALKSARASIRKEARGATATEREKLYSQFLNRLILLLINGVAVGGLMLAAFDYVTGASVPERSPVVLGLFLGGTILCAIYWGLTYRNNKGIEGVRGMASFALIVCTVGTMFGGYDVYTNNKNLDTYYAGEKIVIKDKQNTAKILEGYIDKWRHTPNYCLVHISDKAYYVTVYNSKGESITQLVNDGEAKNNTTDIATGKSSEALQNIAVTLKDSTAVVVTKNVIERRKDVDNLRYTDLALQWAAEGKADITRISTAKAIVPADNVPKDGLPGTEYAVEIKGTNKIKEFYATVLGDKSADDMLKSLTTVSNNDVKIRFHVSIQDTSIGVATVINISGEDKLLWYIDNYTTVYDWELGKEDWYTYDYKDAAKNEKMIQEAVYNSTTMLNKFGVDSGLAYNGVSSKTAGKPDPADKKSSTGIADSTTGTPNASSKNTIGNIKSTDGVADGSN